MWVDRAPHGIPVLGTGSMHRPLGERLLELLGARTGHSTTQVGTHLLDREFVELEHHREPFRGPDGRIERAHASIVYQGREDCYWAAGARPGGPTPAQTQFNRVTRHHPRRARERLQHRAPVAPRGHPTSSLEFVRLA